MDADKLISDLSDFMEALRSRHRRSPAVFFQDETGKMYTFKSLDILPDETPDIIVRIQ